MSTTPEFTEEQLATARAAAWHQGGEPLLTLEAAREWVANYGLVPFTPQAQTLGAPGASLVEATLGEANTAPTAAQTDTALGLLSRMVAEGSAVPLNLLGGPGDLPDFVASTQVFSFCYTLRGDKGWKQPPAQTGAVKVSPLALRVFETLSERGSLTAAALATELGREVTPSAVLRALGELWAQLRVLPRREAQNTAWELSTQRFTKAIKAGSNAGLPKALSALVSLYLHQAISASEAEVESFLSPLTARSRIREVVHALTAARELETLALDGKTLLYVADTLPEFAPVRREAAVETDAPGTQERGREEDGESSSPRRPPRQPPARGEGDSEGRISRFKAAGARGSDLRGKPVRPSERRAPAGAFSRRERPQPGTNKVGGFERPARREKPGEERRPTVRREQPPAFTRPWEDDRRGSAGSPATGDRPPRPFRPRGEGQGERPSRPSSFRASGRPRTGEEDRPAGRSASFSRSGAPERSRASKPFGDRPPRRTDGGEGRREFRPSPSSGERNGAFRRDRTEGGGPAGPPSRRAAFGPSRDRDRGPRPERPSGSERRPFTRSGSTDGASGKRRAFAGNDNTRSEGARGPSDRSTSSGERRPFARPAGKRRNDDGERRPFRPRNEERGERTNLRPSTGERPARPARPRFEREGSAFGAPKRDSGERPRRDYPGKGEGSSERSYGRAPSRFGESSAGRSSSRPTRSGPPSRPSSARAAGRSEGSRPARPGGAGAARGPRPGGFKGASGPRKGGAGSDRPARPFRRPDAPAGEP